MRTVGATSKSTEDNKELIWLALQEHDDWVTSAQLGEELGINKGTIKSYMRRIKQEHPNIISNKMFGYKVIAEKKNSEGYSDPTAKAAIDNVDTPDVEEKTVSNGYETSLYGANYDNILPGTLWETSSSGGMNKEYFFVIVSRVNNMNVAFGLSVYREDLDRFPDRKVDIIVSTILEGDYLGDMSCLRCKPMKYFKRELTIKKSSETLNAAKTYVSTLIGNTDLLTNVRSAGYNEGYAKGINDGQEGHKLALAESYQSGLKDGQQKGYDTGYSDGKKEADEAWAAKETPAKDGESVSDADIVQLITERNLYKTFYEQLLEVMKGGSK